MYDSSFDMEDFYGDVVTLNYCEAGGPATVTIWAETDYQNRPLVKRFNSEDEAYNWAFRHGYRE